MITLISKLPKNNLYSANVRSYNKNGRRLNVNIITFDSINNDSHNNNNNDNAELSTTI